MNKRTLISLCILVFCLISLIAVCIYALYHDIGPDSQVITSSSQDEQPTTIVDDAVEVEKLQSDALAGTQSEETKPDGTKSDAAQSKDTKPKGTVIEIPKGPFIVKNCATGKNNLLRQNGDNSLSLIDEGGRQLWKIPFPGKLCGMVGQVDFYNNGKIQFLVVEGETLHLIDRLGREVKTFPRKLPAKAVIGPDKVEVSGKNYWRIETENGTVYADLKANRILDRI